MDDFGRMMTEVGKDQILIPITRAVLFDPNFVGFTVPVRPWTSRPYDGRFHPSQHSTWDVRQLYIYLTAYRTLEVERMSLTSVLAVTAGTFWHNFLQRLWLRQGILLKDEVKVDNHITNVLGHADGMLSNGEALEIKTTNEWKIGKVDSEQSLKELMPSYWSQAQIYLMELHVDVMRFFFMSPGYPFPMAEFTVKSDKVYQASRIRDFLQALALAKEYPDPRVLDESNSPIPQCCGPRSTQAKNCPTWRACPIGREAHS